MNPITKDQILEILSRFTSQVRWDELGEEKVWEEILALDQEQFAAKVTAFLENGCRFNSLKPTSIKVKPFFPEEYCEGLTEWKGELSSISSHESGIEVPPDSRAKEIKEIDLSFFLPVPYIGDGKGVNGIKKLFAVLENKEKLIRLGPPALLGFYEDWLINDTNSALEWLYRERKIEQLDFPGEIFSNKNGNPLWLYLKRYPSGRWIKELETIDYGVAVNSYSACYKTSGSFFIRCEYDTASQYSHDYRARSLVWNCPACKTENQIERAIGTKEAKGECKNCRFDVTVYI